MVRIAVGAILEWLILLTKPARRAIERQRPGLRLSSAAFFGNRNRDQMRQRPPRYPEFVPARFNPTEKALWYIESHFRRELPLEEIAAAGGVSRYRKRCGNKPRHGLKLVEAIKMDETLLMNLQPPRFENGRTFLIAGLSQRYNSETSAGIPAQWQRFGPYLGHIPGQVGRVAYGVLCNR